MHRFFPFFTSRSPAALLVIEPSQASEAQGFADEGHKAILIQSIEEEELDADDKDKKQVPQRFVVSKYIVRFFSPFWAAKGGVCQ